MPTKSTRNITRRIEARVRLQNASRARKIPSAARVRRWVRAAADGPLEVTVRLVGEREGRQLNFAYRGKDHATNVLTFTYQPLLPVSCAGLSGDIVLCPSVIVREARKQRKPLLAHYAHLTVHAVLHLRGFDHARTADAARMERAEIRILKRLGHPNPYLT